MSDVGDVHLQFEVAVFQLADGDGVVEIAGGDAVDGDDGQIAEITSLLRFARWDDRFRSLSFFENVRRKNVRQMKFSDDDFDVHAEIIFIAQDLDYASAWILGCSGPV